MLPDLSLPSINDGDTNVLAQRQSYEFANKIYNDTIFDWIMDKILSQGPRNGFQSLIFGSDIDVDHFQLESIDLANVGVSTLRHNDFYTLMDYGQHGG